MPGMHIDWPYLNLRQFRPHNKSLVADKEVQFCVSQNVDWPLGLHLDNLFTARQHDLIQRGTGQDDKNVGHNKR